MPISQPKKTSAQRGHSNQPKKTPVRTSVQPQKTAPKAAPQGQKAVLKTSNQTTTVLKTYQKTTVLKTSHQTTGQKTTLKVPSQPQKTASKTQPQKTASKTQAPKTVPKTQTQKPATKASHQTQKTPLPSQKTNIGMTLPSQRRITLPSQKPNIGTTVLQKTGTINVNHAHKTQKAAVSIQPHRTVRTFPQKQNVFIVQIVSPQEAVENRTQKTGIHRPANKPFHEHIPIETGEKGRSYNSVFGKYLNRTIQSVAITDPYIQQHHQFQNLIHLCELLRQKCQPGLKKVTLITCRRRDTRNQNMEDRNQNVSNFGIAGFFVGADFRGEQDLQNQTFSQLRESMKKFGITFEHQYKEGLHDRKIELSDGVVIEIGRGLDYFQKPKGKEDDRLKMKVPDWDRFECKETTVHIYCK